MKPRSPRALIALTIAAVGALVLFCCRPVAPEAVYPVEKAHQTFVRKVASRLVGMFRAASVNAENLRLKRELSALSLVRSDFDRVQAENDRLRRALGYAEARPKEWVAAGVLSESGASAAVRRVLRVDKGSLAGVSAGAVVVVPEGVVGRVTLVTPHTSEVTLISDPSLKVACEVESVNRGPIVRGILCGGSSELLLLKYLSGNPDQIEQRARVMTSGVGGVFPRGLEVGVWMGVGEVLPSVDFASLEDVFIRREK